LGIIEQLEDRALLSVVLTGMRNIGQVDLPTGVPAQYSGAIDQTTGFGYFGSASGANPGIVSKINLNGPLPTVVQDGLPNSVPLNVGHFNAIEIDTTAADATQHYLYVAGNSGHILKMSPGDATHDPQVAAQLAATSASGGILGGAIDTSNVDPTQRYAYFLVMETSDSKLLRVRLSDFSDQGSETLNMGNARTCAIDTIHHYLYCTTYPSTTVTVPQICKVNLATFTPGGSSTATCSMGSTTPGDGIAIAGYDNPGFDIGLSIDPVHQFAYLGSFNATSDASKSQTYPYNQSIIVRVNLGNGDAFPAHPISVLKLGIGEQDLTASVIDLAHGNVYFGTDLTYPGHVYKIHVGDGTQPMTEIGRLDLNLGTAGSYPPDGTPGGIPNNTPENGGEIYLRSAVFNATQNAIYFGTDGRPGQIIKVATALGGDANVDGMVDVADLGALASHYGTTSGAVWAQGDFDWNGTVDVADLGALATNYGASLPSGAASAAMAASNQPIDSASGAPTPDFSVQPADFDWLFRKKSRPLAA